MLKGRTIKYKLVKDCIALLNELAEQTTSIEINWIEAHIGHDGNKLADKQAKLWSQNDFREGEQDAPLAKACCKAGIDTYTRDLWNLEGLDLDQCRQTMIRWTTGHNFL